MENIWLISIVALIVGAVIGFLMGRSGGSSNRQAELAEQLESSRTELENYKLEVNDHFEKTASLVNDLTHSYKDVHEHLATGAQGLCTPGSINLAIEPAMHTKLEHEEKQTEEASAKSADNTPEPPRDYAPKKPEDEGTLSETFGLKEDLNEESPSTETDVAAVVETAEEKTEAK